MKTRALRIVLLFSIFLSGSLSLSAETNERFELKELYISDTAVWNAVNEINMTMSMRRNSLHYPIIKITMYHKNDVLIFDARAIDNSWENVFYYDDVPIGFFTRKGRIFIVTCRPESIVNSEAYFFTSTESRVFSDRTNAFTRSKESPAWRFLIKGKELTLIDSSNMSLLDKKLSDGI